VTLPAVQRETVAGDTDAIIRRTSVPFNPPRSLKSSIILETALVIFFDRPPPNSKFLKLPRNIGTKERVALLSVACKSPKVSRRLTKRFFEANIAFTSA